MPRMTAGRCYSCTNTKGDGGKGVVYLWPSSSGIRLRDMVCPVHRHSLAQTSASQFLGKKVELTREQAIAIVKEDERRA